MVSLAVGRPVSPGGELQPPGTWMDSMLQDALWLPDNPPRNLFFNEESFFCGDPLVPGYRPVVWKLFGKEDGSWLSSLVKIVAVVTINRLKRIEFWHRRSQTRAGSKSIYRDCLDVGNHPERFSTRSFGRIVDFNIDGPGGERISDVAAVVHEEPDEVQARYFDRVVPLYYKVSAVFLFSSSRD
jgi:hypothetical protein